MDILTRIKDEKTSDWSQYTKEELNQILKEAYAELEIQSSANINNKIKINAGYGILSNDWCRWKKHVNAEAITSSGQLCVRGVGEYIIRKTKGSEFQVKNLYSDTDSIFINYDNKHKELDLIPYYQDRTDKIIEWNQSIVQPHINHYFDNLAIMLNAVSNKIEMDFELIAEKSIFLAPKKYIMLKEWENFKNIDPANNIFKVRGVEIVRTTTPLFFREKLKEAVIYIFNKTNDELLDFVANTKKQYFELGFNEMANPSGVNNMDKYSLGMKGVPLHVYGCLVYNDFIESKKLTDKYQLITDKAKIKFAYIKLPNQLNSHVIACPNNEMPPELSKIIQLDFEHQFDKNFMNPIRRFLEVIGWSDKKSFAWDDIF